MKRARPKPSFPVTFLLHGWQVSEYGDEIVEVQYPPRLSRLEQLVENFEACLDDCVLALNEIQSEVLPTSIRRNLKYYYVSWASSVEILGQIINTFCAVGLDGTSCRVHVLATCAQLADTPIGGALRDFMFATDYNETKKKRNSILHTGYLRDDHLNLFCLVQSGCEIRQNLSNETEASNSNLETSFFDHLKYLDSTLEDDWIGTAAWAKLCQERREELEGGFTATEESASRVFDALGEHGLPEDLDSVS